VIDLDGKVIMPGMTEAHTHLTWDNALYIQDIDFKPIHARGEMTLYTDKEVRAAVEEAHARGKRVYTHARSSDSVKYCIQAGVDIIGHADFINIGCKKKRRKPCCVK
jgi:imidazolonepropionase-like amidohydrolase